MESFTSTLIDLEESIKLDWWKDPSREFCDEMCVNMPKDCCYGTDK